MKNFKHKGDSVEITAGGAVVSGEGQVIGSIFGVAESSAASGEKYSLVVEGVVELALDAATAVAVGDKVDYDNAAKDVVADTLGDLHCGIALEAKSAAAGQTVLVKLGL